MEMGRGTKPKKKKMSAVHIRSSWIQSVKEKGNLSLIIYERKELKETRFWVQ